MAQKKGFLSQSQNDKEHLILYTKPPAQIWPHIK